MGECQSVSDNRRNFKHKLSFDKLDKELSINSSKTACSSNPSDSIGRMLSYTCSIQNKIFYVPFIDFENENIRLLPCGCVRRKDVPLENFRKEYEDLNTCLSKSLCPRHNMQFEAYCFECEIKLCSKCNLAFHKEYFNNHHLFCVNGKNM